MATITDTDAYDTETFNSLTYLRQYRSFECKYYKDILEDVHVLLKDIDLPDGTKQLDLGSGGSIHMTLSSSRKCCDITMSEFAIQNRELLRKWKDNNLKEFDWKESYKYIADKENRSPKEIEDRARTAIKEIVKFNIYSEWPVVPDEDEKYNLVTSCLTLTAVCADFAAFKEAIARSASYLRSGGWIILVEIEKESKYDVGGVVFKVLPLKMSDVEDALVQAGFADITFRHHAHDVQNNFSDAEGHFTVRARKSG